MNTLHKSLAIGLALAATAFSAVAAGGMSGSAPEAGCQASAYTQGAQGNATMPMGGSIKTIAADGARYWRDDILRVGAVAGSDLRQTLTAGNGPDRQAPAKSNATLERISSRVERLGQGIAAAPIVQGLFVVRTGAADAAGEPQLLTLLLAALGVVAFVARRRRID